MKLFLSMYGPILIVLALALTRLFPHIPNFAPITAMALFGGAYLSVRYAFIIPIAAMLVSDYLLLYFHPFGAQWFTFTHMYPPQALFTETSYAVYGSFLLSGVAGLYLRDRITTGNVIIASVLCSLQFFLITNAAVWMAGAYDRSLFGLIQSYIAGLPFLQGTMLGDLFYTSALFGSYEYARSRLQGRTKRRPASIATAQ